MMLIRYVSCSFWTLFHLHKGIGAFFIGAQHQLYTASPNDENGEVEVFNGPVPRDKLDVKFSHSSGPGGQNVNKLNTKAEVRFHLDSADWIPLRVKERVKAMYKSRLNKDSQLMVVSQKYRSQSKNVADAIKKLEQILSDASEVPKLPSNTTVARVKFLKRKAEKKRETDKKYHSNLKRERKATSLTWKDI